MPSSRTTLACPQPARSSATITRLDCTCKGTLLVAEQFGLQQVLGQRLAIPVLLGRSSARSTVVAGCRRRPVRYARAGRIKTKSP